MKKDYFILTSTGSGMKKKLLQAGVEDCLYSGNICLVEWPEKISSRLPAGTVHIYIEVVDEQTRRLRIEDN